MEILKHSLNLLFQFLNDNMLWFVVVYMFYMGVKIKAEWVQSIRSITAILLSVLFIKLALLFKIDPKDVMLVVSLVYNFYFLVKHRKDSGEVENK